MNPSIKAISIRCPQCRTALNGTILLAGMQRLCPYCGTWFVAGAENMADTAAEVPERVVPFTTTRKDFEREVLKSLARNRQIPDDIFDSVTFRGVEGIFFPAYLFEGRYNITQAAGDEAELPQPKPRSQSQRSSFADIFRADRERNSFAFLCPATAGGAALPEISGHLLGIYPTGPSSTAPHGENAAAGEVPDHDSGEGLSAPPVLHDLQPQHVVPAGTGLSMSVEENGHHAQPHAIVMPGSAAMFVPHSPALPQSKPFSIRQLDNCLFIPASLQKNEAWEKYGARKLKLVVMQGKKENAGDDISVSADDRLRGKLVFVPFWLATFEHEGRHYRFLMDGTDYGRLREFVPPELPGDRPLRVLSQTSSVLAATAWVSLIALFWNIWIIPVIAWAMWIGSFIAVRLRRRIRRRKSPSQELRMAKK